MWCEVGLVVCCWGVVGICLVGLVVWWIGVVGIGYGCMLIGGDRCGEG